MNTEFKDAEGTEETPAEEVAEETATEEGAEAPAEDTSEEVAEESEGGDLNVNVGDDVDSDEAVS